MLQRITAQPLTNQNQSTNADQIFVQTIQKFEQGILRSSSGDLVVKESQALAIAHSQRSRKIRRRI